MAKGKAKKPTVKASAVMAMAPKKRPEQLYLDGTAPPKDKELERDLHLWQDATAEAKTAAERKKIRHATLIANLVAKGYPSYPYYDEDGKKRLLYPSTETKAKTKRAPSERQSRRDEYDLPARDDDVEIVKPSAPTEVSDPFGSTRRDLANAEETTS